ncbi:unnamed protein product [Cuscuta campestris]|uniref:Uncharacterized protein n=1 Tax=Cuscuta campestris TaxID=132261 RepID=A0A484LNU6_9ASTE|nr:unnamed protein product [Cuscuta campestris]
MEAKSGKQNVEEQIKPPLTLLELNMIYERSKPISLIDMPMDLNAKDGEEEGNEKDYEQKIENYNDVLEYVDEEVLVKGKKGKGNKKEKNNNGQNSTHSHGNYQKPSTWGRRRKK